MFPTKLPEYKHYHFRHEDAFPKEFHLSTVFHYREWNTVGMHLHDFCEVIIVASGSGMHYISDSMIPFETGDVLIIPKNMEHGYLGDKDFTQYTININDLFFEKYKLIFQGFSSFYSLFEAEPIMRGHSRVPLHLKLTKEQQNILFPILDRATQYYRAPTPLMTLMSDTLTSTILAYLCNFYDNNLPAPRHTDERFLQIISMIHEKYYEQLSTEMLAKKAHLSRCAFTKKFAEICGVPPHEYITKIRITAAKDMLTNTQYSISEVALRTGFYDATHFSKVFTQKCGIAPGTYRKQIKK